MISLTHNSPCGHLIYPLHFPGNGLFETLISPIQRKPSLLYTYTALILTQPIFETFIFVITIQKSPSKPPIFALIFVYLLQINFLSFRLKNVYLKKIKDVKA